MQIWRKICLYARCLKQKFGLVKHLGKNGYIIAAPFIPTGPNSDCLSWYMLFARFPFSYRVIHLYAVLKTPHFTTSYVYISLIYFSHNRLCQTLFLSCSMVCCCGLAS